MARTVGVVDTEGRAAKAHILKQRTHILNGTKCDAVPDGLKEKVGFQLKRLEQPNILGVKAAAKPKTELDKVLARQARANAAVARLTAQPAQVQAN